jgi:hypothetical protein
MQEIVSKGDDVTMLRSTAAYIKLGTIAEDANNDPIIGIEIGQKNENENGVTYNQFARFTTDALSFYSSRGDLLAEFGDDGMVVPEAKVTGNLTLGNYKLDTSNGIAFKWQGV